MSKAAAGEEMESAQVGNRDVDFQEPHSDFQFVPSCSRSHHRRPHSTQVPVEEKEGVGDKRRLMIKLAASTALASVSVPVRGFVPAPATSMRFWRIRIAWCEDWRDSLGRGRTGVDGKNTKEIFARYSVIAGFVAAKSVAGA